MFLLNRVKSRWIALKLFLSFFGTAVLAVALLAASISIWFRQKSLDDINSATKLSLYNIHSNFSGVLDSANKIAFEIFKNPSAMSLLMHQDPDDFEPLLSLTQHIDNLMLTNPWFLSASLYDGSKCVYTDSNDVHFKEEDAEIQNMLRESNKLTPIPRKLVSNQKTYNVFTIIYYEAAYSASALVININADILYNSIYPSYLSSGGEIFLADRSGRILLHNDKNMFMNDSGSNTYIQSVLASGKFDGSFPTKINGKRFMVNYIFDNERNIFVISISDFNKITYALSRVTRLIVISCLIVFVIVLFVSLYVSRRFYSPINTIFNNIRRLMTDTSPASGNKRENDIQLLSDTILKTVEKINHLEKNKQESMVIQREAFLKSLLASDSNTALEDIEKNLKKFDVLDLFAAPFLIVVFRIDNYKEFKYENRKEAIDLHLISIGSISSEALQGFAACSTLEVDSCHTVLIVSHVDALKQDFSVLMLPYLQNIKSSIQQALKLSVTIGMSEPTSDISSIGNLYKQAFSLTNYRFILGKGLIVKPSDLIIKDGEIANINNHIDKLLQAVKNISLEQYDDTLKKLFDETKNCYYERIIRIFSLVAQQIYKIPSEIGLAATNPAMTDYLNIYNTVSEFEDYTELRQWFMDIFISITNQISNINDRGTGEVVSEALNYLKNNFTNPLISANNIAEKLSITPQYFSRIFKENTGTGFPEYLNHLRLEKAKELILSQTDADMDEICQKVGYNNRKYFSTLFKNKYGVLPSKLRQIQ